MNEKKALNLFELYTLLSITFGCFSVGFIILTVFSSIFVSKDLTILELWFILFTMFNILLYVVFNDAAKFKQHDLQDYRRKKRMETRQSEYKQTLGSERQGVNHLGQWAWPDKHSNVPKDSYCKAQNNNCCDLRSSNQASSISHGINGGIPESMCASSLQLGCEMETSIR